MSADVWHRAARAAAILAVDPAGLGGVVLQARAGPAREAWLALLNTYLPAPPRRLPPEIADDRLLGGLDLAATLQAGRPVGATGLLVEADGGVIVVPMAERMSAGLAGRLAAVLDTGRVRAERAGQRIDSASRVGLVLLDEAAEPDEAAPAALTERLALHVRLDDLALADLSPPASTDIEQARERLSSVRVPRHAAKVLTASAAMLGVSSMRAPLLALRAARVIAALSGRRMVRDIDLEEAAVMVLAPRATRMPAEDGQEDEQPPPPPEPQDDTPPDNTSTRSDAPLEDRVLEAARAILPELGLDDGSKSRARGADSGSGAVQRADHGRPAGSAKAKPDGRARLDVLATLREAAPWQTLRRRETPGRQGLIVKSEDFRARRFFRPAESVVIFLVDASGSAAAARLAEAKGAVELMLSEAYRRREKVALIAFRGSSADLILPPTRSLLAAKRQLAVLPGGGGTPLAAALIDGRQLAIQLRRQGATPYMVLLTDGRGNIALDGTPGRQQALIDTQAAAKAWAYEGLTTVLIDTANRPQPAAAELASALGARYLPLPRADAKLISQAARATGT
ncbi:MAG: magnesium chelatase subunit D [Pseudomonadota bacterium]